MVETAHGLILITRAVKLNKIALSENRTHRTTCHLSLLREEVASKWLIPLRAPLFNLWYIWLSRAELISANFNLTVYLHSSRLLRLKPCCSKTDSNGVHKGHLSHALTALGLFGLFTYTNTIVSTVIRIMRSVWYVHCVKKL